MSIRLSQSFVFAIALFIGFSATAVADPEEDVVLAEKAMDEQDLHEAAINYRKAAEQNYLPAQTALGQLLRISQDYEEAFGWFLMAAYQGDAAAAYGLGQAYANGEGVEKSLGKAVYWITHAAEKNNLAAAQALALAYRTGDLGLPKDIEQAKKWEARLPALSAAEQKQYLDKLAALKAAQKAARKAAFEATVARKEAAKKAEDEAAVKKVDDADPATAK